MAAPGLLRCPHCHRRLDRDGSTWRCATGHAFDEARQGYVNLLAGRRRHTGDTAEMLDAREQVLGAGHLDAVTDALVAACGDLPAGGALVEAGAGTAHHLRAVGAATGPRPAIAMDVSVAAARRAARAAPSGTQVVVADVWEPWPLGDAAAAVVLSVFAPRNLAEAARALAPGGRLVVVTPTADHLAELREALGLLDVATDKERRLRGAADAGLVWEGARTVRATRAVDAATARAIALMGPSAHHLDRATLGRRIAALPRETTVTVAARVHRYTAPAQ